MITEIYNHGNCDVFLKFICISLLYFVCMNHVIKATQELWLRKCVYRKFHNLITKLNKNNYQVRLFFLGLKKKKVELLFLNKKVFAKFG